MSARVLPEPSGRAWRDLRETVFLLKIVNVRFWHKADIA